MKNEECKMYLSCSRVQSPQFSFFILHFAFCIAFIVLPRSKQSPASAAQPDHVVETP
jgi:hypothetical protein